jgi:hypothetical protein
MRDTPAEVEQFVAARYRALSGAQRLEIAAGMFDGARALVLASLGPVADPVERRRRLLLRFYPELAGSLDAILGATTTTRSAET